VVNINKMQPCCCSCSSSGMAAWFQFACRVAGITGVIDDGMPKGGGA
jgi:hypothetical protein